MNCRASIVLGFLPLFAASGLAAVEYGLTNDQFIFLSGSGEQTVGLDIVSTDAQLIPIPPGDLTAPADPFQFLLSNNESQVTFGSLGTPVTLDGVLITRVGFEPRVSDFCVDVFLGPEFECRTKIGLPGDFDQDGALTPADADLLDVRITVGDHDPLFDLNGDELVDPLDGAALLRLAGSLPGDTDLDGTVRFGDFLIFAANFGARPAGWSQGDFNWDLEAGFPDFLLLADNFGESGGAAAVAVPEPLGLCTAIGWFAVFSLQTRRRMRFA